MLAICPLAEACCALSRLLGSAKVESNPSSVLDGSADALPVPLLRSATATSADTATRAASCRKEVCL